MTQITTEKQGGTNMVSIQERMHSTIKNYQAKDYSEKFI
jgi:hypothetical protein